MASPRPPIPLFDAMAYIDKAIVEVPPHMDKHYANDYHHALAFLKCYTGSLGTFNSYRREVERILQWGQHIAGLTLTQMKREHIEAFVAFCQNPPKTWIGIKKAPRFIDNAMGRVPNPEWRPFVSTLSKAIHRQGKCVDVHDFALSQGAIKELFAILSTFFNYLIQEEYLFMNPIALIRQKSKYIRKQQNQAPIRRLSTLQWEYVLETTQQMALHDPNRHERTLFIMTALYSMYLRISELAASARWTPKMGDFFRDHDGHWWFRTVGKGNKERQIAVSDSMLNALKRYRLHLGLSAYPAVAEPTVLLSKQKGKGAISSTTYLREVVQLCFDRSIQRLQEDNFSTEAQTLNAATVHWLRHTGISDDVKHRPREHVRDDAGHSSSATTDKYIDVEMRERHKTARHKPMLQDK